MAMLKGKTPFMKAEDRVVAQFVADVEALGLGLKANTHSLGGMYAADGVFVLDLQTEMEPVKGNKAKMEALRAAGYVVDVFAPYSWGRRRCFVAHTSRRVEITAGDLEEVPVC